MKNLYIFLVFIFSINLASAQEEESTYVYNTFRGSRIVNGHSVELQKKGEMDLVIAHRFGAVNTGFYDFFGLDQASMRWGLDYGLTDWMVIGMGRSNIQKKYDAYFKARILRQSSGAKNIPVSLTWFSNMTANTDRNFIDQDDELIQSIFAYTHQLLIARKFGSKVSLQVMPTLTHKNYVLTPLLSNDIISIGAAGKFQVSKNLAITAEYYFVFADQLAEDKVNSLSVGFDINTGGHVFQLHLSNSTGMIEDQFITGTTNKWTDGGIHIGFNMVRTFKLKGRRY